MRTCPDCKETKPVNEFGVVKNKPSFYCKCCRRVRDHRYYHSAGGIQKIKARRAAKKDAYAAATARWLIPKPDYAKGKLLQKYWPRATGIEALGRFTSMLRDQNGVCAICKNPETSLSKAGAKKKVRDLCVDHCHKTGKVRGLLCSACNLLIAQARDNAQICRAAGIYLEKDEHAALSISA